MISANSLVPAYAGFTLYGSVNSALPVILEWWP